jgi:hypothetical protein
MRPLLPAVCRRALVGALALAWGCSGVEEVGGAAGLAEPGPPGRLARVHVVVQPPTDLPSDEPALEVSARFVQYRGLDAAAVRARVDLRPLARDRLRPDRCVASDTLWLPADDAARPAGESVPDGPRELLLLDVGNLGVQIGEASVDVPLSLVPDLLAYMSGVEYDHASEALPARAWAAGEPGPSSLAIAIDGEGDELPGVVVRAPVPEPVELQPTASPDRGSLLLGWRPDGREPIVVRLSSSIGSEPAGDEVTCLISDTGSHRLDLDDLRSAGLDLSGDSLHLAASRFARVRLDPGDAAYGEDAEVVVEVRSHALVVWP